jgi:hypothetical protein
MSFTLHLIHFHMPKHLLPLKTTKIIKFSVYMSNNFNLSFKIYTWILDWWLPYEIFIHSRFTYIVYVIKLLIIHSRYLVIVCYSYYNYVIDLLNKLHNGMTYRELLSEWVRENDFQNNNLDTFMLLLNTITLKLLNSIPFKFSLFPL